MTSIKDPPEEPRDEDVKWEIEIEVRMVDLIAVGAGVGLGIWAGSVLWAMI